MVWTHLETLGLDHGIDDNDMDVYIVLDNITTWGSLLEAVKQLLVKNGVKAEKIIKVAATKTMHDDDYCVFLRKIDSIYLYIKDMNWENETIWKWKYVKN